MALLFMYLLLLWRKIFLFYNNILNKTDGTHISDIVFKSGARSFLIKYHIIESSIRFSGKFSKLKYDVLNPNYQWFRYSNQFSDVIFIGIAVTRLFDVTR